MILQTIKKIIPRSLFSLAAPIYHYLLAIIAAIIYRFPARRLYVIGVTGTKGKTTVTEMINVLLETAGEKTALASTLRFKINEQSEHNQLKMTMPGRTFLQKFFHRAIKNNCRYAILEITSEGAKQYRHKFLGLNALIVTNISPEHIEAHGSYANYLAAKLSIGQELKKSKKPNKIIILNAEDKESAKFASLGIEKTLFYQPQDFAPARATADNLTFVLNQEKIGSPLGGEFNLRNWLAAITLARQLNVSAATVKQTVKNFRGVRGRMEIVIDKPFKVIVDYAHTADSLAQVYGVYRDQNKICVLGGTGGGRDKWKRPVMGSIASEHCRQIILTDEDPYDENPQTIVEDIARGIKKNNYEIIMDRRAAIRRALTLARPGEVVMITGKGTDPFIMGPNGQRFPWDDATVAREEFRDLHHA